MKIRSVREVPSMKDAAIEYISSKWDAPRRVYEDCITHAISTPNPLPQWYLLMKEDQITGCAGLITNDFISRMDLYPWLCALYIEESQRGNSYGWLLIERIKKDTRKAGFKNLYLSTSLDGFYEKYGFRYLGKGYHPWDEESKIYEIRL